MCPASKMNMWNYSFSLGNQAGSAQTHSARIQSLCVHTHTHTQANQVDSSLAFKSLKVIFSVNL